MTNVKQFRNDEYEKRSEPVTFRTSERKASWLNDVARVRKVDRSFLLHEIVTSYLENQERVRTPECRTREVEQVLKSAEAALIEVRRQMCMMPTRRRSAA